ncbi:FAD-dependent oxidoreductase [Nocardia brasiliensis]|uniref:Amine oxidase n=1 Tax=Nocardia brasiliensis (strain ATCC 700358 / HUJEG-1) TaxID=1133849 RepID=K0EZB1_NOCB7|nr:FAD-dependent oxidoreductase [Nocardia brasiliensis]AFU02439.1 amine oxidase [Nocardia brasiliensis ATCC 700358]OCF85156.1 hypothetical protein AW168_37825 [Nocardia brasiliensis]
MAPQQQSTTNRYAVVGAGIAGLAAAHRLRRAGHDVELIERDAVLGGRMGLDRLGTRPIMVGGKNLGRKYSELRAFLTDLGDPALEPFGINTSRVVHGRLLTFDSTASPLRRLRVLLDGGSIADLVKLFRLAVQVRRKEENRFLGSADFTEIAERSDERPLSAHFGPRAVRNILRAMTVRMNGAEPDEVYLGTFGTNLGMLMDTFDQLTDGMDPVIAALAEQISVSTRTVAVGLVLSDGGVGCLRVTQDGGPPQEQYYDGVVVALPAPAAAQLLASEMPTLSKQLAQVAYFPAAVAVVEYDEPVFGMTTRAIALDDGPCSNAGVYGTDDLHIVRYTFSGRAARSSTTGEVDEWLDQAEARIAGLLGRTRMTRVRTVVRQWEAAYCAYLPFHGSFLRQVRTETAAVPGLELAGDYLRGAPLEAAFRSGVEAADRLLASAHGQ